MMQKEKKPEEKTASAHAGHRSRMREKLMKNGIDGFQDHEVLEILLYFSIPQKNTNELAHRLLEWFGSLSGVLHAPSEELRKIPGVGESTVSLLKFIPELCRRYREDLNRNVRRICSYEEAGEYLVRKFTGRQNEVVVLMLLDSRGRILFCDTISSGSVTAVNVYIKDVVRAAVRYDAVSAVLAHNHPSGECLPSKQDLDITRWVWEALNSVEVTLTDHIIVSGEDFLSLAKSGILPDLF